MTGSSFGKILKLSTWGESHGDAIGCVVDGFPAGIPIDTKYIQGDWTGMHDGEFRYFHELQLKFKDQLFRVVIYCISFILLGMHLVHGLGSSLQSMGITKGPIKLISTLFSILVPFGFILIAVFHYLN